MAPRAGSKCSAPVPTYTAATHPAKIGLTTALGTMYFFDVKKASTTPCTVVLRGMLPGTCAITRRENSSCGWRALYLVIIFAICLGVVIPISATTLRCNDFG